MKARRDAYMIQSLINNKNYNSSVVMGYEAAGYILSFGREVTTPYTPIVDVNKEYIIRDEETGILYTNPVRTFCDLLNRDEFVTGEQFEICVNILEHYIETGIGEDALYKEAQKLVPSNILDANWEDLHNFYDYQ
ncbi:hypothetical protein [Staphylococcus aureus]|uniref:hypothetical protein n=1 Tax=Staphylococcus aureus TaxID=1280 RepID=UPI0030F40D42